MTGRGSVRGRLTLRDLDTLRELRAACDSYAREGWGDWVKPLHCGGYNGSHHSNTLQKLVRLGLAERKGYCPGCRTVWHYRITDAGRDMAAPR